jgi:hypothetical protein
MLRTGVDEAIAGLEGQRYSRPALADAIEEYGGGQDEKERAAFAAAVLLIALNAWLIVLLITGG